MKISVFAALLVPILFIFSLEPVSGSDTPEKDVLLPSCPDRPNCVSSLAADPARRVEPFPLRGAAGESMEHLLGIIRSMPRSRVTSADRNGIRAEFRSLLGFVDDLQFALSADRNQIHVRSAARSGYWDLGVNRRRVERIRRKYLENRE